MQITTLSAEFASDASGDFGGTLDFGEVSRSGIVIDAFVILGTATGYSGLTILDGDDKDVLAGAGAAAQTANKVYSWNSTGGTAANIQQGDGLLTVDGTGAGNAKTLTVGVNIAR